MSLEDDLLDGLDDLPSMMNKLASPQREPKPSRFQELGPNQSLHMSVTLHGNEDHPKANNQLASQARKVLNQLNQMNASKKTGTVRPTEENAKLAEKKLRSLKDNGVDLTKFYYQYDTLRTGCISYKDFSDTLLAVSSGIGREDAMLLAASLDKKKTGHIEYKNILSSLTDLQKELKKDNSLTHAIKAKKHSSNNQSYGNGQSVFGQQEPELPSTSSLNQSNSKANMHHVPKIDPIPSSYLEMYNQRITSAMTDPKAVVNVQALSPNRDIPVKKVGPQDEEPMVFYSGRRYFYNQENAKDPATKAINARLNNRTIPFHVDPSPDTVKEVARRSREQQEEKDRVVRRSSSAPPRSIGNTGTSLMRVLEQSWKEEENKNKNTSDNTAPSVPRNKSPNKEHFSHSLKAALQEAAIAAISEKNGENGESSSSSGYPSKTEIKAKEDMYAEKLEQAAKRQVRAKQSQSKVLENRVVRQLAGKINNLRHILRTQDRSKSGLVNLPEFRQAMIKCGVNISIQETEQLFNSLADTKGVAIEPGYTGGKAMEIDTFVNRIQNRTTAPAFSHVVDDVKTHCGQKATDIARMTEEARVIKKVLLAMSKVAEPKTLIESVTHGRHAMELHHGKIHQGKGPRLDVGTASNGMLTKDQFRQSLQISGANLQDHEFDVLLRTLKLGNGNGGNGANQSNNNNNQARIDMNHIDQYLFQELTKITKETEAHKEEVIKQNPRYGQTFASQVHLGGDSGYEFDQIIDSKKLRQDSLYWHKLTEHLQKNYDKILDAFKRPQHSDVATNDEPTVSTQQQQDKPRSSSRSRSLQETLGEDPHTYMQNNKYKVHNPHLPRDQSMLHHRQTDAKNLRDSITFDELKAGLRSNGVMLSDSDFVRLQHHVQSNKLASSAGEVSSNNDNGSKLSLEDFCSVVGIPVRYRDNNKSLVETVELVDSHLNKVRDVGVFATSEKSIAATSKFGTSMYLETDDSVHRALFSHRKKKFQSLSEYTKDPSKFWDLMNSVDDPLLFPYPHSSCRDPLPSNKSQGVVAKDALRGVVTLSDHINKTSGHNSKTGQTVTGGTSAAAGRVVQKPRLTVQELMNRNMDYTSGLSSSEDGRSSSTRDEYNRPRQGIRGGGKRSSSAPPRSSNVSDDGSSGSFYIRGQQMSGQSSVNGDNNTSDNVVTSIQKWSNNSTLADFYASNNKGKSIRGGGRGRSGSGTGNDGIASTPFVVDGVESTTPVSITSMSTKNGTFSNPGTPRGDSRKHSVTGSAAAPFATADN